MSKRSQYLLGLLPVCMAGIVYWPVLGQYFKRDDFLHLYEIANYGVPEFLITPHGGHLLVSSNLAWVIGQRLFGANALGFQAVAFLTHLLNVWLLYHAIRHWTARPLLASFGASLWGMAPMAWGSVMWFSVFGHVMVGTAVTWILCDVARLSQLGAPPTRAQLVRWYVLFLVAATSFGVGLGVAAAAGAILFLLRPGEVGQVRIALAFGSLLLVIPMLYWLQFRVFMAVTGAEPFRPSIELGGLLAYPLLLVDLLAVGLGTLLMGPLTATEYGRLVYGPLAGEGAAALLPIDFAVAAIASAGVVWVALRGSRELRLRLLGLALASASAYGMIALGRAHFVQTPPLNPAVVGRYHYAGTIGLTAALCLAAARPLERVARGRRAGAALLAAWVVLSVPFYAASVRSYDSLQSNAFRAEHERVLASLEQRVRGFPEGEDVYLQNGPFVEIPFIPDALFPRSAAVFLLSHPDRAIAGRRVFFVESNAEMRRAATARPDSTISQVLVAPAEVPDGASAEKSRRRGRGRGRTGR